jgi:hypothetical protein
MEQPFNKNVDIKFSTHAFNFGCYVSIEKKIMETNLVLKDVIVFDLIEMAEKRTRIPFCIIRHFTMNTFINHLDKYR